MLYERIQLEHDETILAQTRRHWFLLFGQLLALAVAATFPYLFLLLAASLFTDTTITLDLPAYLPQIIFGYAAWILLLWMAAFNIWTNHYLDILTITNRRIIMINQQGFFRRYTGSFRLERLQDMHVEIHGILPTLLNYGELHAETAGQAEREFQAVGVPDPRELRAIATKATDALIREYRARPLSSDGV